MSAVSTISHTATISRAFLFCPRSPSYSNHELTSSTRPTKSYERPNALDISQIFPSASFFFLQKSEVFSQNGFAPAFFCLQGRLDPNLLFQPSPTTPDGQPTCHPARHIKQFAIPEMGLWALSLTHAVSSFWKMLPSRITLAAGIVCESKNDVVIPKTICKGDLWVRAGNSHLTPPLTSYLLKCKATWGSLWVSMAGSASTGCLCSQMALMWILVLSFSLPVPLGGLFFHTSVVFQGTLG